MSSILGWATFFWGSWLPPLLIGTNQVPAVAQHRCRKMHFRSEIHSWGVNKHSGSEQKVHSFQPGIRIHISRNPFSHPLESFIHMPGIQRIFGATILFGTDTQRERATVVQLARLFS